MNIPAYVAKTFNRSKCGVNIFNRCRMADRVQKVQMKLIDGNHFLWQLQIVRLGKCLEKSLFKLLSFTFNQT